MNINKSQAHKWRFLPRISYFNYHKLPYIPRGLFSKCFEVEHWWGGRLIFIRVKHHQIELDFRKNWMADMANQQS